VSAGASVDGGDTWLSSVRVSERPNAYNGTDMWPVSAHVGRPDSASINLQVAVSVFFYSGGHTGAMAVGANGVFYPFWCDNRTGVSQIWTSPVTVAGTAVRNGSADLAALDDVTSKVTLVLAKNSL
jgi:hypothetical protein